MEYELYHYGILGMKWGIRRYQNKDGSLTAAGRARLNKGQHSQLTKQISKTNDAVNEANDIIDAARQTRISYGLRADFEKSGKFYPHDKRFERKLDRTIGEAVKYRDKAYDDLRNEVFNSASNEYMSQYKSLLESSKNSLENGYKELTSIINDDKKLRSYAEEYVSKMYGDDSKIRADFGYGKKQMVKEWMDAARGKITGTSAEMMREYIADNNPKIKGLFDKASKDGLSAYKLSNKVISSAISNASKYGSFDKLIAKNNKARMDFVAGRTYVDNYTKLGIRDFTKGAPYTQPLYNYRYR